MSIPRLVLAAVRRARTPANKVDWRAALDRVIAGLEELNRSTERDFLAVGGKLAEMLAAARQISSDMAALAAVMSGEQCHSASRALNRMLERAQQMDTRTQESSQALVQVRELAGRARLTFSQLGETVSVFRALCTLTRTETSRLGRGGTGFSDLADQVKPLSEKIQSSGEEALAASSRLDQSVQTALRTGAELSARELKELHALIAVVEESLKSFEERQLRALEASRRQAAEHAAVCAAIEDLVQSIQFHDITRQQIEHVVQALRQVRSEPGIESRFSGSGTRALTLQCSQLSGAGRAFAVSIGHMIDALEGIAARVRAMAASSQGLMGYSSDEKDTFFERMEGCFDKILKAAGCCAAAEAAIHSTAGELAGTIGGMQQAVREIQGIEIQIHHIAINATVRSAQIGQTGNALNVIADFMHRLVLESSGATENAAAALDKMREAAGRISGSDGSCPAEEDGMTREMRDAIGALHSSAELSFKQVNRIAALSARLSSDIQRLREGISVGVLFEEAVSHARRGLESLGALEETVAPGESADAPIHELERFAKHYTMQAERDVHAAVTAGQTSGADAPAEEPLARSEGDLGDNVELF